MSHIALNIGLAVLVLTSDTNRLPKEDAQRYAKVCVEQAAGKVTDAQIAVAPDAEKPCATRGEGGGAMVIPDKKLSEKIIAAAGKEVVPVGQLWLRKWTVVANGKAVPNDKLRIVTINVEGKDRPMPLLLLGVRKKGAKELELVVYAAEGDPIMVLPLKKVDFIQDLPIEIDWERGEKKFDRLPLTILGKYRTVVEISR